MGGECRNSVLLCAAVAKERLVEWNAWSDGATGRVEIYRNKGGTSVSRVQSTRNTPQNCYCNLLFTDMRVAAILASGFPYSVHPCLRVFHETPTMQVAAPTMQQACCCPTAARAGK